MHLMENGLKVEGGDKLGKTIIFAKNSIRRFYRRALDSNYPHFAGKFCQKIDYPIKYAQSLIDDFSSKEKMLQIAVSVDMLENRCLGGAKSSLLQADALKNQILADGG